ncbi:MAG: TetR family transcriptional regulator [Bacteroidetes bacterium]|jgi:AcrR family transcriptional regulator|nr:TetR family transcriptional regulator [Bacteroidota bacterium]
MAQTKEKILQASIDMFNEYGIANVRLQHIADASGISVGNLAYHFKNKPAIIDYVYDHIFNEFSMILSDYLILDNFQGIDKTMSSYYFFFEKYRFFFTNMFETERNHPHIMKRWHRYTNRMIIQIESRIDFDIQRDAFFPLKNERKELLANNIWMSIIFWLPQRVLRGLSYDERTFKKALWAQMTPFLSNKGKEEFATYIQPAIA